jgi:hypothetical protein
MLWWGRKDGEGAARSGRGLDHLVQAVTERFDGAAAGELQRRGWRPLTQHQRIGWAVATGDYADLVHYPEDAVEAVQRSEHMHEWCTPVLHALDTINTDHARALLVQAVRNRWRAGDWDAFCGQSLRDADVAAGMADELAEGFDGRVARALAEVGWNPATMDQYVSLAIANRDLARAAACGSEAVPALVRAMGCLSDTHDIVEALASIRTPEAAAAVVAALRESWAKGRARWTDFDTVTGCGAAAVPPLIDLMVNDPTHTTIAMEMLTALAGQPQALDEAALQALAAMPDVHHIHYMPEDPRGYDEVLDCSGLRAGALAEMERRQIQAQG